MNQNDVDPTIPHPAVATRVGRHRTELGIAGRAQSQRVDPGHVDQKAGDGDGARARQLPVGGVWSAVWLDTVGVTLDPNVVGKGPELLGDALQNLTRVGPKRGGTRVKQEDPVDAHPDTLRSHVDGNVAARAVWHETSERDSKVL